MPNFTKKAIQAAFIKLLSERPYNEISVKDVVSECGINRNSFYYHYQDMIALVEELAKENCDRIIERYPAPSSFGDCLQAAIDFAEENKQAIYHIYRSVDRAIFEKYLWKICAYGVEKYLTTAFPKEKLNDLDRDILLRQLRCQSFGQIMNWMEGGMKADIRAEIPRLSEIYQVLADNYLKKVSRKDADSAG